MRAPVGFVSYKFSTVIKGTQVEMISESEKFTDKQKALVKGLLPGQNIYFQNIIAVGPDGARRPLQTISLKIKE
ncbi:MAG: hypothetical protein JXA77_05105 [Bacteroidales bacterium]|nr:hypothetical protein [Bacteroidales bacterium]MBN2820426.1 hypothetical protein [Bacteroidales bacterium]